MDPLQPGDLVAVSRLATHHELPDNLPVMIPSLACAVLPAPTMPLTPTWTLEHCQTHPQPHVLRFLHLPLQPTLPLQNMTSQEMMMRMLLLVKKHRDDNPNDARLPREALHHDAASPTLRHRQT